VADASYLCTDGRSLTNSRCIHMRRESIGRHGRRKDTATRDEIMAHGRVMQPRRYEETELGVSSVDMKVRISAVDIKREDQFCSSSQQRNWTGRLRSHSSSEAPMLTVMRVAAGWWAESPAAAKRVNRVDQFSGERLRSAEQCRVGSRQQDS
jgi:hypothetical protein